MPKKKVLLNSFSRKMGLVFLVNTILDLKEMGGCSPKKAGNIFFSGVYLNITIYEKNVKYMDCAGNMNLYYNFNVLYFHEN